MIFLVSSFTFTFIFIFHLLLQQFRTFFDLASFRPAGTMILIANNIANNVGFSFFSSCKGLLFVNHGFGKLLSTSSYTLERRCVLGEFFQFYHLI